MRSVADASSGSDCAPTTSHVAHMQLDATLPLRGSIPLVGVELRRRAGRLAPPRPQPIGRRDQARASDSRTTAPSLPTLPSAANAPSSSGPKVTAVASTCSAT